MKSNAAMAQRQRDIFASNLRRCMVSAKKEQIDIAKALGVTSSTVSDWANAKKYPRVDKMQALADYLGVLLSDLREEKPTIVSDDELWKALNADPAKATLARWIMTLDQDQLQRVIKLLDAALLLPGEKTP
ncbi:helix-turn-helix domain-containing protein [Anaerotruncus colihominis]|uniref:helix-turn-helix domain-containing protein n=1 Tax=Anaerotruncus colihominis TaxID=169435 RepID=UPI00351512E2